MPMNCLYVGSDVHILTSVSSKESVYLNLLVKKVLRFDLDQLAFCPKFGFTVLTPNSKFVQNLVSQF